MENKDKMELIKNELYAKVFDKFVFKPINREEQKEIFKSEVSKLLSEYVDNDIKYEYEWDGEKLTCRPYVESINIDIVIE